MGQDNASHHHHAMSVLRSDQAAKVNGLRVRRVPRRWKKIFIKGSHTRLPYRAVQKSGQFWVRVRRASKLTTTSAFSRGNRTLLLTLCQEFWNRRTVAPVMENIEAIAEACNPFSANLAAPGSPIHARKKHCANEQQPRAPHKNLKEPPYRYGKS
jgi:hypothetical protein